MIERNSDKLLYLIKQMLDMSKIEAGSVQPEFIQDNIISYLQYGFKVCEVLKTDECARSW